MNKQTWTFPAMGGTIPGIPGEWHIGQEVDIDADTNAILAVRTRGIPPVTEEKAVSQEQTAAKKKTAGKDSSNVEQ